MAAGSAKEFHVRGVSSATTDFVVYHERYVPGTSLCLEERHRYRGGKQECRSSSGGTKDAAGR